MSGGDKMLTVIWRRFEVEPKAVKMVIISIEMKIAVLSWKIKCM